MTENIEFICETCNYKTLRKFDLDRHMKSKFHERNGKPKEKNCKICNYVGTTHWTLKLHTISQHSTLEERKQQKYYCDVCDIVFFSPLYKDKHFTGNKHNKMLLNYNEKLKKETINSENIL